MVIKCLICGKERNERSAKIKIGRGKYCSKECANFALKGKPSWNKGLKGVMKPNSGSFRKGEHKSPLTEFKKGGNTGENNHNWKDNGYSTVALHMWVYRKLGKPKKCEFCESFKNVQWANKSELYKREIDDWISLCAKCHKRYDIEMHKIMGVKSFRQRRFING